MNRAPTARVSMSIVALCVAGCGGELDPGPVPAAGHPLVPGRIAISMTAGGNVDVYAVEDGGTGLVRLTTDPAQDGEPSWSPDGTRLAFASTREGTAKIYLMNADGSGVVRLTDGTAGGTAGRDFAPDWSPDGSRIAFVHEDRIFLVGIDGSDLRAFDPPLPVPPEWTCRRQRSPSWSADGSSLVYVENLCFSIPRVYRAGLDGSVAVLLAEVNPGPSPRLIFAATVSPTDALVYVYSLPDNPEPGSSLSVPGAGALNPGSPAWAPDGSALVFVGRTALHERSRLYVMGADGSGLRQLGLDAEAESPDWTR